MSRKGKRILRLLGLCAGLVGGVLVLGFAERSAGDRPVNGIKVHMYDADGVHFLDEVAVERVVLDQGVAVLGAPMRAIDLATMALLLGLDENGLRDGLSTFRGVARRFDMHVNGRHGVLIDDYAHHPVEVATCLASVRALFPGRHITAVFQPHLFTRTRDLGAELAASLDQADRVLIMPIYPAREEPIAGITSEWLIAQVQCTDKRVVQANELVDALRDANADVVVMMGAGDIGQLAPAARSMMNARQR